MTHCQERLPESKRYLYVSTNNKQDMFVFQPEWRLFAPKRLTEAVSKGVRIMEKLDRASPGSQPNAKTIAAMIEAERICKDPTVKDIRI